MTEPISPIDPIPGPNPLLAYVGGMADERLSIKQAEPNRAASATSLSPIQELSLAVKGRVVQVRI